MNQANFLFGYEVITVIIVLVTTKEKSLVTDINQENWILVIRLMCPTGSDLFCLLFVAYYCPLLSVSKTHKKHKARQTLTFSDFSDTLSYFIMSLSLLK